MPRLKLVLVLTENWTMVPGTDLPALVRMAIQAEDDDPRELPAFCREVTRRAAELAG